VERTVETRRLPHGRRERGLENHRFVGHSAPRAILRAVSLDGETRGALRQTPLGELLIQAFDRRWTGALEVGEPDVDGGVLELVSGVPVRVLVPDGYARLGDLLVERGIVTEAEVAEALSVEGMLLGSALAEQQRTDEQTIDRALGAQVLARAVRLAGLPPTTAWRFSAAHARFADAPPGRRVDPLRIASVVAETHGVDDARIDLVLMLLDDAPLVLRDDVKIERFGLQGDALAVVSKLLADEPTFGALVASGVAPEAVCRRIVHLLATARFLRQGDDARASVRAAPSSPGSVPRDDGAPFSSRKVTRIQLRRVAVARGAEGVEASDPLHEKRAAAAALLEQGPIDRLGLDPQVLADATERRVKAMLDAAHADRAEAWQDVTGPEELIALQETVRAALDEARASLAEPDARARELERLGVEPSPESRMAPDELHERALYALHRQAPETAARLCDRATELAPDDLELLATSVWIRSHLARPDLKVLMLDLDDVLLVEPDHVTARYYRAMLRRRLGQDAAARQDLEKVLALEPDHAAARAHLR
jgi:tetratricopeptide (TPR) repeat protein